VGRGVSHDIHRAESRRLEPLKFRFGSSPTDASAPRAARFDSPNLFTTSFGAANDLGDGSVFVNRPTARFILRFRCAASKGGAGVSVVNQAFRNGVHTCIAVASRFAHA